MRRYRSPINGYAAAERIRKKIVSLNCSNQFRRSGQRDDRRRLLLNEGYGCGRASGSARSAHPEGAKDTLARKTPHYGQEALAEQPRVTDLVPLRLLAHFLLLFAGLAAMGGIALLYAWMPHLEPLTSGGRIAAFDLAGRGNLAAWFSSSALLAASVGSVLVYSVRRYKTDDYRGYYRIWLWAATFWLLMSIDTTAGLRDGFKDVLAQLTGTAVYGDGTVWWAVPYLVLLSALGSRLIVDAWPARLSTAALVVAGACLTAAVVGQVGWVHTEAGAGVPIFARGAEMLGCWMLFVATALHARYVLLDAAGLLPRRAPKAANPLADPSCEEEALCEADVSDATGPEEWIAIDSPHQSPAPVLRRRSARKPEPEFDAADAAATVGRKLTKQEKKALRARLTRERLQREQSQQRKWT